MRQALLLAGSVLAGACASDPTEIVLVVDGEMLRRDDLDTVVIDMYSPAGARGTVPVPLREDGSLELPLTLGLVPHGEELSPVMVRVEGRRAGHTVVSAEAITGFVEFERRALPLWLDAACAEVHCLGDDAVCVDGECVDRRIPALALPTLPPDL